jgi:hypothetical protein
VKLITMPKNLHPSTSHPEATARPRWLPISSLLAAIVATTLVACGGGGGGFAGVGTGGTGSFAVGTVGGFGSVIVNGVRYDDSNASILDDDDNASSAGALAIGQVVELRGSVAADGLTGKASSVAYYSELKGPVTAVDPGSAGTVTVFGQVVKVKATTVFQGISGLSALTSGNVIEVYGLPDASGGITATRIEFESATIPDFTGDFRVRGVVSGRVATSTGQRFSVGSILVGTNTSTQVVGTVAEGAFVKVRLDKTAIASNTYLAKRVKVKERAYESGVSDAELQGLVSEFTSPSAPFKVNGYPAQLGTTVMYQNGVVGDLINRARIEAKGAVTNGVLVISKVEFDDESNEGGSDGNSAPFEFKGVATCSATPCGSLTGAIVVRGVTVQYDTATTRFSDGLTTANLNGARVEVKAIAQTGTGATTFLATRIQLDN